MTNDYWNLHYNTFTEKSLSKFCQFCLEKYVKQDDVVVELGCGNGRDAIELSKLAYRYIGIDLSEQAIINSKTNNKSNITLLNDDFTNIDFNNLIIKNKRLLIYSRFTLHSITLESQKRLFNNIKKIKTNNWLFMFEVRTIYDKLYGEGKNIGKNEFLTDHYRRFINPNNLLKYLTKFFSPYYYELSNGFAPYKDEDPILMRAIVGPKTLI